MYIHEFSYKFDTVLYQSLEAGYQIELLPDVLVTLRLCAPDDPGGMLRNPYGDSIVKFVSSTPEPVINYTHIIGNHFV